MQLLAFDTETHLIRPGMLTPRIVCGTWADSPSSAVIALREDVLDELEEVLREPAITLVGANLAFDFGCACALRPHLLPLVFKAHDDDRVFDILLAEALNDIREGCLFRDPITSQPFHAYSQALVETRLLGIDRSEEKKGPDAWRLRYGELDGVPLHEWPAEACGYPLDDVKNAFACAEVQRKHHKNLHAMGEQARAAWALHLNCVWGLRTSKETVAEVTAEIEAGHVAALARFAATGILREDGSKDTARLARLVAEAYGATQPCKPCGGTGKVPGKEKVSKKGKVTPGKPAGCRDCGSTGLDIQAIPQTATGKVKCDRDMLEESGNLELEAFADVGENEKWRSTYLPVLARGAEIPITPRVNVLVATGRHSIRDPNLANLPRGGRIRECFVPRPGHWFGSIDYGMIELCTLAQTCLWLLGESRMAEAINSGQDLHDHFAGSMRNISYEEQLAAKKSGDKTAKSFRTLAKCGNFGLPGGLGAPKLVAFARQSYKARFCELSGVEAKCGREMTKDPRTGQPLCAACLSVAKELRRKWFETWEEIGPYHQVVSAWTDGPMGGEVTVPGPAGSPGLTRGGCSFTEAANLSFQGLAARGGKSALYRVSRESYLAKPGEPLFGVRPVVFIYDELLVELPQATAHEAAHRISEIMIEAMRVYTPDVRVTAPPALMARWLKGAEPVYVDGRLVPWEPEQ